MKGWRDSKSNDILDIKMERGMGRGIKRMMVVPLKREMSTE